MTYKQIFSANREWAESKINDDENYFKEHSRGQSPEYFWIGCADSRLSESEITGGGLGKFFVHRNVANLVNSGDPNFAAALHYAVDYLEVKHIVVAGHHDCGGVKAAYDGLADPALSDWLSDIKQTLDENADELESITDESERIDRLSELSVIRQVRKLEAMETIKNARARGRRLRIHGLVFDVSTGVLKPLTDF